MNTQDRTLAFQQWKKLSLMEQMANIGSEVERAISWRRKGNKEYSTLAFHRLLELIDFTLQSPKNKNRLKEIARVRELLVDYFFGDNQYRSTDEIWQKYFLAFTYYSRKHT